ncbi:peptidoglycan-binding protein [bacterium]|jgi:hypothetical protein|nr:peptidoglycan-binding protein [bacterium]
MLLFLPLPAVYLIEGGQKRLIPNEFIFLAHNFRWQDIETWDDLDQYLLGDLLDYPVHNFQDGTLIKEKNNPQVYLIEDHEKRYIPSESIFLSHNFKWQDVIEIIDLSSYPIGQNLATKKQASLNFSRSLNLGMTGEDVRQLQTLLAQDEDIYPEAKVTGYFGPLTEAAVQRLQLKHNVVSSAQDQGYGIFGPKTRATINAL